MGANALRLALVLSTAALSPAVGSGLSPVPDEERGSIAVVAGGGERIVELSGVLLPFREKSRFRIGTIAREGAGYRCRCRPADPSADWVRDVELTVVPVDGRVRVECRVSGVPPDAGFRASNVMLLRRHADGFGALREVVRCGRWRRQAAGGVPVEELEGSVVRYKRNGHPLRYVYPCGKVRADWRDGHSQHFPLVSAGDGVWKGVVEIVHMDDRRPDDMLAAAAAGRRLYVSVSTPRVYNWFDDRSERLAFAVAVGNVGRGVRDVAVETVVRDFDGRTVHSARRPLSVPADETVCIPFSFSPVGERGIYFIETVVTDPAGGEAAFSRTNIAHLPRYDFMSVPTNSVFGIATYWPIPSEEDVQTLMDRMGVRWVRNGDGRRQHPPRIAYRHTNLDFSKPQPTGAAREAWIRRELGLCVENGNPAFEFCNELNMSTGGIALEGKGIGKCVLAPIYAEWMREIRRIRDAEYPGVRLLSFGIAGDDRAFLRKMKDLGTWDDLDEIGLHPGRGNFTPDYPCRTPEDGLPPPDRESGGTRGYNFWNYLGAVRLFKNEMAELGGKPLLLSEVYVPTFPNGWWEDSLRDAADNLVLTYALAAAEGVTCAMIHQLFDGVWHDRCGIDPRNREYHFGLLNRDLSFKPACMAYCAVAEALDGAVFRGWMKFPNTTSHGLSFDTPRGRLAIVWDRSDGYVLTVRPGKGAAYAAPEPWVKRPGKTVDMCFAARGRVAVGDSIGRYRNVKPVDGKVTIPLDISPRLIYGVDAVSARLQGQTWLPQ